MTNPISPEPSARNPDHTERVIIGITSEGDCQLVLEYDDAITLDLAGVVALRRILQRIERRLKGGDV